MWIFFPSVLQKATWLTHRTAAQRLRENLHFLSGCATAARPSLKVPSETRGWEEPGTGKVHPCVRRAAVRAMLEEP